MKKRGYDNLSTHNMESVEELCDDIALINRAKLVVTGPTGQIRENMAQSGRSVISLLSTYCHLVQIFHYLKG